MQIFLDSADVNEIIEINNLGIVSGITTNPTLMSKTTANLKTTISEICKIIQGDVSAEVVATDLEGMLKQGNEFLDIASNIVIKLPMTWDGIKACKHFASQGAKVNMTLCFSSNQAVIAAIAGATYISPFIGRLDDIGLDGVELIQDIKKIYLNYQTSLNTKILAASIRNPNHFYRAAIAGADVTTMSGKILKQLLEHPLTNSGLEIFNKDWANSKLKFK